MMAAIRAAERGKQVVLIEKNEKLGKKLYLSGNGRCNLSNNLSEREFVSGFGKNGNFLLSSLKIFSSAELIDFFEKRGLQTKTEKDGKVYPKSDKARDVVDFFEKELKKNKVKILINSEAEKVILKNKIIEKIILKDGKEIVADNFLIATGGKSYPQTGSDGGGYALAKKLGHSIVPPEPALAPVQTREKWPARIKGVSLKEVEIGIGKPKGKIGEVLFTHFGISGPLILNLSEKIKPKDIIYIDLFPNKSHEELEKMLLNLFEKSPKKKLLSLLSEFMPERMAFIVLELCLINSETISRDVKRAQRNKLVLNLKKIKLTTVGVLGFEKAMATRGGVYLKEIDAKNMKSKIIDNLYFAGEVIDLNGQTGGFNLQMCFTSGYVVGENIL